MLPGNSNATGRAAAHCPQPLEHRRGHPAPKRSENAAQRGPQKRNEQPHRQGEQAPSAHGRHGVQAYRAYQPRAAALAPAYGEASTYTLVEVAAPNYP